MSENMEELRHKWKSELEPRLRAQYAEGYAAALEKALGLDKASASERDGDALVLFSEAVVNAEGIARDAAEKVRKNSHDTVGQLAAGSQGETQWKLLVDSAVAVFRSTLSQKRVRRHR